MCDECEHVHTHSTASSSLLPPPACVQLLCPSAQAPAQLAALGHREGHVHAPPSQAGRVSGSVSPGASLLRSRTRPEPPDGGDDHVSAPVSCGICLLALWVFSFCSVDVPTLQERRKGSETRGNLLPTTQLGRGDGRRVGSRCWSRNPQKLSLASDCFSGSGHCTLSLQASLTAREAWMSGLKLESPSCSSPDRSDLGSGRHAHGAEATCEC